MNSRFQSRLIYIALSLVLAALTFSHAHAQGGRCSNNAINQAYNTALHRAPNGSATSGECNPTFYGAGSWVSQQDLVKRVAAAVYCSNNYWIGQIYYYEYNRFPNNAECSANYGYTSSMSYMQLDAVIKQYVANGERPVTTQARPPAGLLLVTTNGSLIDSGGNVVALPGAYVLNNTANIVAQGGLNGTNGVVAQGGLNLINPQPGMLVNTNGSNAAQRSIQSAGGKRVISGAVSSH